MTIEVWHVILILLGHWVADFWFQPTEMGKNKSKSWTILGKHSAIILVGGIVTAAVIAAFNGPGLSSSGLLWWAILNAAAHFLIDAVSSRITGKAYAREDFHTFFSVIGADQFLHVTFAIATFAWLAT